jgi:hypothetical protein
MSIRRSLISIGVSGLALIVWGMLFWGALSPRVGAFRDQPIQQAAAELLAREDTRTGTYFFPWPRSDAGWEDAHREGPFFKLSYVREGADPSSPAKLALGSLHNLLVAALANALILLALPALPSFGRRFALVFGAGVMGSLLIQVGDPVWFHLPWDYASASLAYELGSWALLGATAGALLRPELPST